MFWMVTTLKWLFGEDETPEHGAGERSPAHPPSWCKALMAKAQLLAQDITQCFAAENPFRCEVLPPRRAENLDGPEVVLGVFFLAVKKPALQKRPPL